MTQRFWEVFPLVLAAGVSQKSEFLSIQNEVRQLSFTAREGLGLNAEEAQSKINSMKTQEGRVLGSGFQLFQKSAESSDQKKKQKKKRRLSQPGSKFAKPRRKWSSDPSSTSSSSDSSDPSSKFRKRSKKSSRSSDSSEDEEEAEQVDETDELFPHTIAAEQATRDSAVEVDAHWENEVKPSRTDVAEKNLLYGHRVKDTWEQLKSLDDDAATLLEKVSSFDKEIASHLRKHMKEKQEAMLTRVRAKIAEDKRAQEETQGTEDEIRGEAAAAVTATNPQEEQGPARPGHNQEEEPSAEPPQGMDQGTQEGSDPGEPPVAEAPAPAKPAVPGEPEQGTDQGAQKKSEAGEPPVSAKSRALIQASAPAE